MSEFCELVAEYETMNAARLAGAFAAEGKIALDRRDDGGNSTYFITLGEDLYYDPELKAELADKVARVLRALLRKHGVTKRDLVMTVGVGNEGMTADALGAKTLKYLDITEHLYAARLKPRGKGRLSGVASGVSGVTGLESYEIVRGVTDRVSPKLVIAVYTLAARQASRLKRVVQISDRGLVPGSGVSNARAPLNAESLGVPVVAIGVPLVIYARNILLEYAGGYKLSDLAGGKDNAYNRSARELEDLVVTLKEIDVAVEDFAEALGRGINAAVHGM